MAPAGSGVGWTTQLVPSQRSASVDSVPPPASTSPTAVHAFAPVQSTPDSTLFDALGVVPIVQNLPFQVWTTASKTLPFCSSPPTAAQKLTDGQDTVCRSLAIAPFGICGGWSCQRRDQSSARAWLGPSGLCKKPTAVQAVAKVHDTPNRPLESLADVMGVGLIFQEVPSHCSATTVSTASLGELPTAMHLVLSVHDTRLRSAFEVPLPPGLAMVCIVQFEPSQRAAKPEPVAVHAVAAVQDTPSSGLNVPRLVLWMVQLLPFHFSARAGKLLPVRDSPTASHEDAETQETSLSWLEVTPAGFGVGCTLQELPFHTSARVSVVPPLSNRPTASQNDDDVHEMPGSCPPPGSGILTIVQVLPLRLSERRLLLTFPTAIQVAVPVQDTADRLQVGFDPDGVGVFCCCQLAEAGCAITRTADTTSAA